MSTERAEETAAPPVSEGWTRRFTAMGARLDEAVSLYRGLGYEVRLAPADAGQEGVWDGASCAQCFVMTLARTIYTRSPGGAGGEVETERG